MEAGGITTDIDAVLSAITLTSASITKFIRSVRAAHADLAAVTRELSDLRLVLELLVNDDEGWILQTLRPRMREALNGCGVLLCRIDDSLARNADATQWITAGRAEMAPLRSALEAYRESLGLVLEVLDLYAAANENDSHLVLPVRDKLSENMNRIRENIQDIGQERDTVLMLLEGVAAIINPPNNASATATDSTTNPTTQAETIPAETKIPLETRRSVPEAITRAATPRELRRESLPAPLEAVHPLLRRIPHPTRPLAVPRRQTDPIPPVPPVPPIPQPPARSPRRGAARRESGPPISGLLRPFVEQMRNALPEVVRMSPTETSPRSPPNIPLPRVPPTNTAAPGVQQPPLEAAGPWYPREDLAVPFYQNNTNPSLPPDPHHARGQSNGSLSSSAPINSPKSAWRPSQTPVPQSPPPQYQANDAPEAQVPHSYKQQQFMPAPVLFEQRPPSMNRSHERPSPSYSPQPRDGFFNHRKRFSDTSNSVPATPNSTHSTRTGSSNEQGYAFGPPSPGAPLFASPPLTHNARSSTNSDGSFQPPPQAHRSLSPLASLSQHRASSVDSFQLAPDPLGVHHAPSDSSPLAQHATNALPSGVTYSPASSAMLMSPTVPLTQDVINSAFPSRIPLTAVGSPQSTHSQPAVMSANFGALPGSRPRSPSISTRGASDGGGGGGGGSGLMVQTRLAPPSPLQIIPVRYFLDKDKAQNIYLVDVSPSASIVASKNGNNVIKIWSLMLGSLQTSIKFTSYVNAQVRSREYFLRSHAILSESATLVGVTAGFGQALEVWNWTKRKRLQVIDEAHRWAAVRADVYRCGWAPLAVYRGLAAERVDLFRVCPDATGSLFKSKVFAETRPLDLRDPALPFVPRFPELAYSATSPVLVAAAGPRPGDPPRSHAVLLAAWQLAVHHGEPHRLYRCLVPEHPEIQNALPVYVAVHGGTCVSIWIPANHRDVADGGNNYRHVAVPVPTRYVVSWDLASNTTRLFGIPNVLSCISPDCRLVAYCDASTSCLFVLDVATGGEEVCRWPELHSPAGYGQLDDLSKVTEFAFSGDGKLLVIGDEKGGVGAYELRDMRQRYDQFQPHETLAPTQWNELQ